MRENIIYYVKTNISIAQLIAYQLGDFEWNGKDCTTMPWSLIEKNVSLVLYRILIRPRANFFVCLFVVSFFVGFGRSDPIHSTILFCVMIIMFIVPSDWHTSTLLSHLFVFGVIVAWNIWLSTFIPLPNLIVNVFPTYSWLFDSQPFIILSL